MIRWRDTLGRGRIAAGVGEIGDDDPRSRWRPSTSWIRAAGAMKTNQTFGIFGGCRGQLREIKCAAMILCSAA
jgi:hypothetical protein